nr:MAG TPA: hypothetical protein [Caudoviricetes sp.]
MARFTFNGIDGIIADFEELAKIDDDTKYSILEAGAEVIRTAQQNVIRRLGLMNPTIPQLINSLTISRRVGKQGGYVQVTPKGKRKNARKHGKRMKKKGDRRVSSGSYAGTNTEVGYYLEYGTPRITATHWMETANEEAEADFLTAEQDAWNKHLDDLNL